MKPLTPWEQTKLFGKVDISNEPEELMQAPIPVPDGNLPTDSVDAPDLDHTPLTFGKHKGLTPGQVATKDPAWLIWAKKTVTTKPVCSDALYRDCLKPISTDYHNE
jgi:hypothetical protein